MLFRSEKQAHNITEDYTDKYIALLKDGLITVEDFKTLITSVKPNQTNYIQ